LNLFTVELRSLRYCVVAEWFSIDGLHDSLVRLLGDLLVDHIVHGQFDPGRGEHVVNVATLVESPVVTDLAHLVPDQVVICIYERIHVTVQALQAIDGFDVELNFHEVLGVGSNHEVDVVPIREEKLLDHVDDVT